MIIAETVFGLANVVFAVPDALGRTPLSPPAPAHLCWRAYDTEVRFENITVVLEVFSHPARQLAWLQGPHCAAAMPEELISVLRNSRRPGRCCPSTAMT